MEALDEIHAINHRKTKQNNHKSSQWNQISKTAYFVRMKINLAFVMLYDRLTEVSITEGLLQWFQTLRPPYGESSLAFLLIVYGYKASSCHQYSFLVYSNQYLTVSRELQIWYSPQTPHCLRTSKSTLEGNIQHKLSAEYTYLQSNYKGNVPPAADVD